MNKLSIGVITVEEARKIVETQDAVAAFGGVASNLSGEIVRVLTFTPIPFGGYISLCGFEVFLQARITSDEDVTLQVVVIPVYEEKK